jgi:SET family sugar efflux transporter-like MFS transporter
LFHTAMFMGSIPLPIVLTTSLGGMKTDVGLMFSLCAALEIIVMGALIWRPLKRGERTAIVAGFAAFVAYFIALALARSVGLVFWAQILRAIGIALVTYLGIGFLQSLLPHRAGAAAALFSNAGLAGSVLAALGTGALAQAFGYASIFVACAILSAVGLAMVCLVRIEPD